MATTKKILVLLVWLTISLQYTSAQEDFGEAKLPQRFFFGISLIPSSSGDLYHFAEIEVVAPGKYNYTWISRGEFIAKASGLLYSQANPDSIDFFKQFEILTDNKYWDPIDNLWRLRFDGHPQVPEDKSGWYIPNPRYMIPDTMFVKDRKIVDFQLKARRDSLIQIFDKQKKMLASFGINKFSDYAMGEKAFKLIKAIQDEKWIEEFNNQKQLPEALRRVLAGQPPVVKGGSMADAREQMVLHKPYQNVTIQTVRRSGLDQLIHGPKGKPKNKEKIKQKKQSE